MSISKPTSSNRLFSFRAKSEDPAVELFLIDARMSLVARGRRELSTEQPLGVYTLKLRAGPATREEVILLDRDLVHPVKPLEFASAVPLQATSQTHEYQQAAAVTQSGETNVTLDGGSSIFVFAREWTPQGRPLVAGHHPAEGLMLCSQDGNQLVDFQKQSRTDLTLDPWAACGVSVKPGMYRLAVRVATGEYFEMALPAMPGFHTKVFLVQRDEHGSGRGRRPNLASASVLLTRSKKFDKDSQETRLAEMAKLALVDRRRVYSTELDRFLKAKSDNPMLGILGGHLLLLEGTVDIKLLTTVVRNLRLILPVPHPDVEALALAAGLDTTYRFTMPPMLRASWRIVLDHSIRRPSLVPRGSLAASLATLVTDQDPWLIWCRPGTKKLLDQRYKSVAEFIGKSLRPSLVNAMTNATLRKISTGISGLDEVVGKLNLPPSTIAHLAERFLQNLKPPKAAARGRKAPAKKAAAKKRAIPTSRSKETRAKAPKKTRGRTA